MKLKLLLTSLCFTLLFFNCSKNDDNDSDDEFDGSIEDVRDFFGENLVVALEDLGFKINTGNIPPSLEGTYLINLYELQASTVPSDRVGRVFSENLITFSNQNNNNLTIDYKGVNGPQEDIGIGSFISGDNNQFSMYLKLNSQIGTSVIVESAYAISGSVEENGIRNIQVALLMLDDKGDPDGVYTANNKGRLFFDSNGLSPKQ